MQNKHSIDNNGPYLIKIRVHPTHLCAHNKTGPASFPHQISSPCFSRGRFGPPIPWNRHDEKSHADGRARSCKCMTRIHSLWDIVPGFIKAFFSNSIILKFEIERENKRYRFSRLTRLISSFKQKSVKSDKSVAQRKFSNSRIRDRKRK